MSGWAQRVGPATRQTFDRGRVSALKEVPMDALTLNTLAPTERDLAFGRLVTVPVPALDPDLASETGLVDEENAFAATLSGRRRWTFVHGRRAVHRALASVGAPRHPVLPNHRGAPTVPTGFRASISHKDRVAVALAAPDEGFSLGVDVEEWLPARLRIGPRVLRPEEQSDIAHLPDAEAWRAMLLRFSLKEAIYKALDPFMERHISFQEVAVYPDETGNVRVDLFLKSREELHIEACWHAVDGRLISECRARRATAP